MGLGQTDERTDGRIAALALMCIDDDECVNELCSHGCVNTVGSFTCQCPAGHSLAPDARTCLCTYDTSGGLSAYSIYESGFGYLVGIRLSCNFVLAHP